MKSLSELTRTEKTIEVLRWIGVLPAAVLGSLATQFIVGAVVRLAEYCGWFKLHDLYSAFYFQLPIFYFPKEVAFVIAGAKMAPRGRLVTAIILTIVGILLSLTMHVLGQHYVGNHVGLVNYMHFAAESFGAAFGVAYIFYSEKRSTDPREESAQTLQVE